MATCDVGVSAGNVYATAAGKHVHFNQTGRGGDIYAVRLDDDVPVTGPDAFAARAEGRAVRVSWDGKWEDLAGFNLYRDSSADAGRVKLNAELITGRPPFRFADRDVTPGEAYKYWLEAVDVSGARETFGPAEIELGLKPAAFALYGNAPNPARGATTFAFSLPAAGPASLTVYDLAGRKVWRYGETFAAGANEVAASLAFAPGVYVYRLEAGGEAAARKIVIIK